MTTIYLLRHGALAADSGKRFIGQVDLPLAAQGITQAEELGRVLRHWQIDAIYCSDLLRSQGTAKIVGGQTGIAVEMRRDLREISLGDWEGLSRREVAERFPQDYAARGADMDNYRIAGGESFCDCRQRVLAAWESLLSGNDQRLVIAGHAGVNRLLLSHLLHMPVSRMFGIAQDYGCINIIEHHGARNEINLINGRPADLRVGTLNRDYA